MSERSLGEIPERLKPLYGAVTAHDGVKATLELVESTKTDLQPKLLSDQAFINIVQSILLGLDSCREIHTRQIINTFDEQLRPEVSRLFLDF